MIPKHVAITTDGIKQFAEENNLDISETYKNAFKKIIEIVNKQAELGIPITTFFILEESNDEEEKIERAKAFLSIFDENFKKKLKINHIRTSFLGKWYDLPQDIVESFMKIIEDTRDYDNLFVNFCVNYSGQEEIVDACKLIAKQIITGKIYPDKITKDTIKENLYSSYFIPPDLIIKNGKKQKTSCLLLWDSIHVPIYFTKKYFPEFMLDDFEAAIKFWEVEK